MQMCYDIWRHHVDLNYIFREEDVEVANDITGFQDFWKDCAADHPVWSRIRDIQAICPKQWQ